MHPGDGADRGGAPEPRRSPARSSNHASDTTARQPHGEQELFRRAFEAAPIGMALVAPDGSFLAVNPALCALLDRSAKELLSTGFQQLTHPDDLNADTEQVLRCLAGKTEGYALDKRYLRPDGSIVWAELHVSLITDERGTALYFISQIADITDRKRIEAELRAYNERLKQLASSEASDGADRSPDSSQPPPALEHTGAESDEAHRDEVVSTGMRALLSALDARDHYTGEHSDAVVGLARELAGQLGLPANQVAEVEHVARLHDIGKVGVPDAILQKPGRLSPGEWELMRQHPVIGARIVAAIEPLASLAAAVRSEHEHFDGSGYPDGLRAEQIPIAARIVLACDAYHAMISKRPYRVALSEREARTELRRGAGSQFDPAVVTALGELLGEPAETGSAAAAPATASRTRPWSRPRPGAGRWRPRRQPPRRGDRPPPAPMGVPVSAEPSIAASAPDRPESGWAGRPRRGPLGWPARLRPRALAPRAGAVVVGGLVTAGVLLALVWAPWSGDPAPPFGEGQPFITASGSQLASGGRPWSPIGYNDYRLTSVAGGFVCDPSTGAIDDGELAETLDRVQAAGGDVIRTWFFQPYWDPDRDGVGDWGPFDRVLAAAAERELRVIPVLANHWADCEAGAPQKDLAFYAGGYRYPYGGVALSYLEYAREVVGRYGDSPTIAFWQLVNEPEAPSASFCDEIAASAALSGFAEESAALVREFAPNHLISLGTIGGDQCGSAGPNYQRVSEAVEVCSVHAYGDTAQEPLEDNIGGCEEAGKPTVAGEVGLSGDLDQLGASTGTVDEGTLNNRADLLQRRLDVMLALGLDGFLIWELVAQPPEAYASPYAVGPGDPVLDLTRGLGQ